MEDKRSGRNNRDRDRNRDHYVSQDTTDYEGVRYTPSARRHDEPPAPKRVYGERRSPATKKSVKRQNSQFAIFFITTVFIGVVICVIVFAIVFSSIIGNRNDDRVSLPTPSADSIAVPESAANKEIVAIITDIMPSNRTLSLFDLDSNEAYSVTADTNTLLKDKYGNTMVLAEFNEGEIVDAAFNDTDHSLKSMQSSTRSWQLVSTAKVDTNAKTITISNTTYRYTNDIITSHDGQPFDLSTLDPVDVVTVKGHLDTAWFVSLDKSHGVLQIPERSDIMNGTIEIDTLIYEPLGETKELSISEGDHHVVIKGSNIEPFTKDITVRAGETQTLDLSELKLKAGIMTIKINEPGATLTVNGEEKSASEPLNLDYGEYEIRVTKEGFADWSKTVAFDTSTYDLDVVLEKIVQMSQISIETMPTGARIYIDNVYVGESPVTTAVEYGLKTITVNKEGYLEISFPVNVITDAVPLKITLQEQQSGGPLDLPSEMTGATPEYPATLD